MNKNIAGGCRINRDSDGLMHIGWTYEYRKGGVQGGQVDMA